MLKQQSSKSIYAAKVLILFSLGALLAGAAELPYGGWIQIPILSFIWWQLDTQKSKSSKNFFALGFAFGLGYFVVGLWWLYISLHDVGGMNAPLACMGVFLLSLYVAFYFSVAIFCQCSRSKGTLRNEDSVTLNA